MSALVRGTLRRLQELLRSGRRVACYRVGDQWVIINHRGTRADLGVIRQCFDERQYEIPEWRARYRTHADAFYQSVIAAGKSPLIVDCGANLGASVLWFSVRYPEAEIVAIEPATDNFSLLRRNCSTERIDLRAAAVGPRDGVTLLSDPGEGAWGYRTGNDGARGYEVPMISVGTVLAKKSAERYEPFILKLDIEGAEKALFAGSWKALDRFPVVVIEPHDWMAPGSRIACGFFRFHSETGRDFVHRGENIFSISYRNLIGSAGGRGNASPP